MFNFLAEKKAIEFVLLNSQNGTGVFRLSLSSLVYSGKAFVINATNHCA